MIMFQYDTYCCFLDAKKQHILNQIDVLKIFKTSTNKHRFDILYVLFFGKDAKKQLIVFFSDCEKLQKISQKTPILKTTNQHHFTHAVSKQLLMALKKQHKSIKIDKASHKQLKNNKKSKTTIVIRSIKTSAQPFFTFCCHLMLLIKFVVSKQY